MICLFLFYFIFLLILRLKTRPHLTKVCQKLLFEGEKKTFLSWSRKFPASISTWGFAPACESEPRNFRGGESNLKPVVMEGCSRQEMGMSGGFCALPNQFIPVHQLSLLFAAARPGRWRDTDAHATQRRLQNPSDSAPSTSNLLRPLRSLAPTGCLSSHSTLEPGLRAALCEFIRLPHRSCWCHGMSLLHVSSIFHPALVWPRLLCRCPLFLPPQSHP